MKDTKRTRTKRRGNGEGSISQRKDGLWVARISLGYDAKGKRERRVVYGKTKREAMDKLAELQGQKSEGTLSAVNKATVATYMMHWLDNVARLKLRQSTYGCYESSIRLHIIPAIGKTRLDRLKAAQIEQMYSGMEAAGLSARMRQLVHSILRKALQHALKQGIVRVNVCDKVERPNVEQKEQATLTAAEAATLISNTEGSHVHALYVLALTTGARQGELLALKWDDINLEAGTAQIQRTLVELKKGEFTTNPPKTAKSRRTVTLNAMALEALHSHRVLMMSMGLAGCEWVFCGPDRNPLRRRSVLRWLHEDLEAAKLPRVRFHDLRHTTATLLIGSSEPVTTVSELLGHAKTSTTLDVYGHVVPGAQKAATDKLGSMLTEKSA